MKKLIIFAFAIIALASCSGGGSKSVDSSNRVDSTIVSDSVNKVDTANVDSSMVCPD